jgi:flagellar protein FliO/FliZ
MRFTLITAGLLLATRAAAADGSLDAAGSLVQMLLGLAVVIGLLYASLHVLKRLGAGTGNAAGLQGARHRRRPPRKGGAGGRGGQGARAGRHARAHHPLHTLDAADLPGAPDDAAPAGKDFQSWLKQTLERRSR